MAGRIGKEFMAATRYQAIGPPDQAPGESQPPLEMPADPAAALRCRYSVAEQPPTAQGK